MQSGKELSLTSQSRNNKPGSAKPKKAMCNGFMSKFILSLLVCFDIGTSQIHVPTSICVHYIIDYTLVLQSKNFSPVGFLTVQVLLEKH